MRDLWILIPVLISILVSLLLGKIFGRGELLDRGFVFCYWNLSYRRKFIRTLWMLPAFVIVMFFLHITFKSYLLTGVTGAVLGITFIIQAVYCYRKWKAEEQ